MKKLARLLWTLAVFIPATSSAQPIPESFFAMSSVPADSSGAAVFPKVSVGVLAHPDFLWVRVEPAEGMFDYRMFDAYMALAQANGLVDVTQTAQVQFTLGAGTPGWAVNEKDWNTCDCPHSDWYIIPAPKAGQLPGPPIYNIYPTQVCPQRPDQAVPEAVTCSAAPDPKNKHKYWREFVTDVVTHYDGSPGRPHVATYELWNEANIEPAAKYKGVPGRFVWWTGTHRQMRALAEVAYPIIHAGGHSKLLTPSVVGPIDLQQPHASAADTWMIEYLKLGPPAYADGGAYHGYIAEQSDQSYPMPDAEAGNGCVQEQLTDWPWVTCYGSIQKVAKRMRHIFHRFGLDGPMYQTEGSWGKETLPDDASRAAWVSRFYLQQASVANETNLAFSSWFTWTGDLYFGWGVLQIEALLHNALPSPTQNPSPAGVAYQQTHDWLSGRTINPCALAADGTWTCDIAGDNGYRAQAVFTTQPGAAYFPDTSFVAPGPSIQSRDLAGNVSHTSTPYIDIAPQPILLERCEGLCANPDKYRAPTDDYQCQCVCAPPPACRGCPGDGSGPPFGCPGPQDPATCSFSWDVSKCNP